MKIMSRARLKVIVGLLAFGLWAIVASWLARTVVHDPYAAPFIWLVGGIVAVAIIMAEDLVG